MRGHATDPQRRYLTLLLKEAFSHGYTVGFDTTHYAQDARLLKSEASEMIAKLLRAKQNGWE